MTTNTRIALTPVESSQIHSIGHDASTNTLAIRFKSYKGEAASLYHYDNFSAADFAAFQGADSIGRHFGQHIKNATEKHPFRKIDEAQVDAGKRRFRFDSGLDISVTVEVDTNVLTTEMAKEIVSFWTSGDEVLDVSNDDVFQAAGRYAASRLICFLIDNYTNDGAIRQLCSEEGWPPREALGMRIVDSEIPEFGPTELEVRELAA